MLRRGRLQEVLLQEQQGYVQPVRRSESYSSLLDSEAWIFQRMVCLISSLTYLIVGHLLSCRGWHCICLFTSIPWFDSSVQSVCTLFLSLHSVAVFQLMLLMSTSLLAHSAYKCSLIIIPIQHTWTLIRSIGVVICLPDRPGSCRA